MRMLFLSLCIGMDLIVNIASASADSAAIREGIAARAELQVGCAYWSNAALSGTGPNTNKNNYFVHDIGVLAGAQMPEVSAGVPIEAGDGGWGTLSTLNYWKRVAVADSPERGDIVAAHYLDSGGIYHVGIYVSPDTMVSANSVDIAKGTWPFGTGNDEGDQIVIWRYCGELNCP